MCILEEAKRTKKALLQKFIQTETNPTGIETSTTPLFDSTAKHSETDKFNITEGPLDETTQVSIDTFEPLKSATEHLFNVSVEILNESIEASSTPSFINVETFHPSLATTNSFNEKIETTKNFSDSTEKAEFVNQTTDQNTNGDLETTASSDATTKQFKELTEKEHFNNSTTEQYTTETHNETNNPTKPLTESTETINATLQHFSETTGHFQSSPLQQIRDTTNSIAVTSNDFNDGTTKVYNETIGSNDRTTEKEPAETTTKQFGGHTDSPTETTALPTQILEETIK